MAIFNSYVLKKFIQELGWWMIPKWMLNRSLFHPRLGKSATAEKGRLETGDLGMSKNFPVLKMPQHATTNLFPKKWSWPTVVDFPQIPIFKNFHPSWRSSIFQMPKSCKWAESYWYVLIHSIPYSCRNDATGTSVSWCWSSIDLGFRIFTNTVRQCFTKLHLVTGFEIWMF